MSALQTYFEMGGYGGFVWPAFGITFVVLVAILAVSWRTLKRREAALAALRDRRAERRP